MFEFIKKQRKEYVGTTIFITKNEEVPVEKLLAIIVGNIENYVRQNHTMPEKLRLSYNNYSRIIDHNHTLVERRNGYYYTFGVQIEV